MGPSCQGRPGLGKKPVSLDWPEWAWGDMCSHSPLPPFAPQMWTSVPGMPTFVRRDSAA